MNQFLNGGPLEDFDRFVLTANLNPASEDGDPYADDHRSIDFSPVVWSLLLKEVRNLPSDEKLEFYNIWVVVNLELRDRYGLAERRPVTADDVLHAIRDKAFELDDLPE